MGANWWNWRVWVTTGVLLVGCSPAQAFYWQGWPGSRIHAQPTLITPPTTAQPPPNGPPTSYPQPPDSIHVPPPPVGPPVPVDHPPVGPPTHTPEPATGLLGLLGMGAIAAVRKWRNRKC